MKKHETRDKCHLSVIKGVMSVACFYLILLSRCCKKSPFYLWVATKMRTLADPFSQSPYHAICNHVNLLSKQKYCYYALRHSNLDKPLFGYISPHTCFYTFRPLKVIWSLKWLIFIYRGTMIELSLLFGPHG